MLEKFVSGNFSSYEDFYKNYRVNVPKNFNYAFDVVDEWAEREPMRKAIVWCDETGQSRTFSFSHLKEYSNKAANFFKSLGIKKGDPVMLILKRRYEFWYCLLGLHKIGAVCIPATHLLTPKDIIYRNNAANIKMIVAVSDPRVMESVEKAEESSPSLAYKAVVGGASRKGWIDFDREIETASSHFQRPTGEEAPSNDDIMPLYFTSGTTGQPKMVQHSFTYPLGHIVTAKYWQNVKDGGLHLTLADTGWAKAAWGKIYGQWIAGSVVFVYDYERFVPSELLSVMVSHGVNTFCAPPTVYRYLIKEDLSQFNLKDLEYCVVAGEPLNPEVYHQFYKKTGIRLMEGYGQTEMTLAIATFPWMEPKPGSMGKPAPGYHIELIDEDGKPCDVGKVGQIVVRTSESLPLGMFKGYYNDNELTKKVWHDGIYETGDTAWMDEDGYFWFVGRNDDVIKSSGYRIGPFEVESALLEHPAVVECAVTGVPDELRGQIVKATVVLAPGYTPGKELAAELQKHVKRVTAPYKYPRIIEFVEELPKTISGKIRRVEIRERDTKKYRG
ncbi:MAG: AMP-dependent synthetase and ligase [Clostridia bacterium 41_269]|nr:MAG: AMP-dependent synthetase and ligase [Clostridia bacterium 41_269]